MLAMAMSDTAAGTCVAYLLDQLVADGRDPAEAVAVVQQGINTWSEARACQSNHGNLEITQEG